MLRHISEYHEDYGDVLWWHEGEAPWVGSPLSLGYGVEVVAYTALGQQAVSTFNVGGWPGYHEWWTPLPERPQIPAPRPGREGAP